MSENSRKFHYDIHVPHSGKDGADLLIVGEAPGEDEENFKLPFIGQSGTLLWDALGRGGVLREDVKVMNLSHYRPYGNRFELLLKSDALKRGLEELEEYIHSYKPCAILALGNWPLNSLVGEFGISKWRGSILKCKFDETIKVIPTYHPAYIIRDRTKFPIFNFDCTRAITERLNSDFNYPKYDFLINPDAMEAEGFIDEIRTSTGLIGTDIETIKGTSSILCIGFAISPTRAAIFPFNDYNRQYIDTIIDSFRDRLCFQFGTFDTSQLELNGTKIETYAHDTQVAQHVMEPELPSGLDFLASIYTRQPYYKKSGRANIPKESEVVKTAGDVKSWGANVDRNKLYIYNGIDCCVTQDVGTQQLVELATDHKDVLHVYHFEMAEIEMAREISMAGMLVDEERRAKIKLALTYEWHEKQYLLNSLCGRVVNVASPKVVPDVLYEQHKLPKKYKKKKLTAGNDAIMSLIIFCVDKISTLVREDAIQNWEVKLFTLRLIKRIRKIRKLLGSYINVRVGQDGRIRSTFKIASTETGRWACQKFVDGSGLNAQTFPREGVEIPENVEDLKFDPSQYDVTEEEIEDEESSEDSEEGEE